MLISGQAKLAGVAAADYDRNALKNTNITGGNARQWTYQYCSEFGWFQTPSGNQSATNISMRSELLNMTYWEDMCKDVFNVSLMINRTRKEFAFNVQAGTNTVFTNGGEDPW